MSHISSKIGFISTRLAGTDGVSLEVAKWTQVLRRLGAKCFYFAGECEWPADRSYVVPEAHFSHPQILQLSAQLFGTTVRSAETSALVDDLKLHLKLHLHHFLMQFSLDMLIIENAVSIPMNIPLGLAIAELVSETGIPTIAHNHDFAWERSRFANNAAGDYLRAAFPPVHPAIQQVVINSFGATQLAHRTGANAQLVPNVMDFDNPPSSPDDYVSDLRSTLGITDDEYVLLQPTRIVPRKRIERAVELASRLQLPCTLLMSHASGDEGSDYLAYLEETIDRLGVKAVISDHLFAPTRGQQGQGSKRYSLADAYAPADIVTYPSDIEGFGNAFLEAVYYRRPLVMCAYDVYKADIRPKGFRVVEFEDYITRETVQQTRDLLLDKSLVEEITAHNYEIARKYYSYTVLENLLTRLLSNALG